MWWGLWAVLASLPWLVPTHAQPWTGFHADAAMAMVGVLLLVWVVVAGPSRVHVPFEAQVLAALAMVPLVQWTAGLIVFAGDAWLAATYVFSLALAVAAGTRAQQLYPWALPNALFAAVGIAAAVSIMLMVVQWVQWEGLGTLLLSLPAGSRPSANLGQPNHLATLLVWGLLALWWAYLCGRVHGGLAWVLAALLLLGVTMTQSRTGALEVVLIALATLLFRQQLRVRSCALALVALGLWFIVASVAWTPLNEALRFAPVLSVQERLAPGTRLLHWSTLLDAVAERPWFGWGWNQVVHAQGQFAPLHAASHEVIQYGHNLILDLVLWNGLPIGVLATVAIAAWCIWQFRLAHSAERALLLLFVAVFLVHAMVELPHGYILFLMPVGLIAGVLHVPLDRFRDLVVTRKLAAIPSAALVVAAVAIIRDYGRIEEAWMAQRLRAARIATVSEMPVPPSVMLSNLQALLHFMRTEPREAMTAQELALLRQVALRYPSAGGLFRYAWALALNGNAPSATQTLVLLCRVHSEAQCLAAKEAWLAKAAQEQPEAGAAWPEALKPP